MKRTMCTVAAATALLIPTTAYAQNGSIADPVGDATKTYNGGDVVEGTTGDSDITAATIEAFESDGPELGVRLRVEVREIDRFSAYRERAGTGLAFAARFTTDTGLVIDIGGHPRRYAWSSSRDEWDYKCRSRELDLPDLRYARSTDTVVLKMPGNCFEGAQSVAVSVWTRLDREQSTLSDRASTSEPIEFNVGGSAERSRLAG